MTQSVSIRLDEEVLSSLDELAKITDRSRAWLMGHAVEQYVQREAWQAQAIKKTLTKVQQGDARFTDHEAVTEWLQGWGGNDSAEPPRCK
ncbi:MAG: CopG family ribbon-helix-helix protein [Immundisolibacteraceae bacterium]|nr:CopG family ribbon-helix-helix protein [Immundisolibacteraceae bacterium]